MLFEFIFLHGQRDDFIASASLASQEMRLPFFLAALLSLVATSESRVDHLAANKSSSLRTLGLPTRARSDSARAHVAVLSPHTGREDDGGNDAALVKPTSFIQQGGGFSDVCCMDDDAEEVSTDTHVRLCVHTCALSCMDTRARAQNRGQAPRPLKLPSQPPLEKQRWSVRCLQKRQLAAQLLQTRTASHILRTF